MITFEFNWIDAKNEGDPLECATFASLSIRTGDRVVTKAFDKNSRSEREAIFIPLYPVARWIVDNWWSLLFEPEDSLGRPAPGSFVANPGLRPWIQRHCMRAAAPGYAFPFACIYSGGTESALTIQPDPDGKYPNTPIEFRSIHGTKSEFLGSREGLRQELAKIVVAVLDRLGTSGGVRGEALADHWNAICSAEPSEAEFCRAAGRMGLDPFSPEDWPPGLLNWFENAEPGSLDQPLLTDLLEAPGLDVDKPRQHAALLRIVQTRELQAGRANLGTAASNRAFEVGYQLANSLRQDLGLQAGQKLENISTAAEAACGQPLVLVGENAIPEGQILGIAGWDPHKRPIVIYRPTYYNGRFASARGLFLGIRSAEFGPRLITDSKTQDQKASRAFAAELLAPRGGVINLFDEKIPKVGKYDAIHQIADHYDVPTLMIEHQIQNARYA